MVTRRTSRPLERNNCPSHTHPAGNGILGTTHAAQRAMAKAREAGTPEGLRDAAEVNYEVLKALGNQREALEMHELYIAMRDSVTNDENKRAVMSKRFQYAYEKKEALLQAEGEEAGRGRREALRRKNVQRNAFIGGFG